MKTGLIYMITCSVSYNAYIGQTVDFDTRIRRHFQSRNECPALALAISKYGKDCFTVVVLESGIPIEDLDAREIFWIATCNTYYDGYNCTPGGLTARGEDNPWWGRTHTEETKRKQSAAKKGKYDGKNNPMFGRHHSEETKARQSAAVSGENNANYGKPNPALAERNRRQAGEDHPSSRASRDKRRGQLILFC